MPHHWASRPTAAVHLSNGLLHWKTSSGCVAHRKQGFLRVRREFPVEAELTDWTSETGLAPEGISELPPEDSEEVAP